jgi:hypothetical protein
MFEVRSTSVPMCHWIRFYLMDINVAKLIAKHDMTKKVKKNETIRKIKCNTTIKSKKYLL